jgi:uncharacterized membrane protein YoaK (UPF0700 family)
MVMVMVLNMFLADVKATLAPPRDSKDGLLPPLLVAKTAVTGLVDAFSYLALGHVFVANMTGNVVFLAFAIAGAGEFSVTDSLVAIAAFGLGAIVASRLESRFTGRSETGRSETGRSETGRSETGRSETGRSETGRSETGRSETGRSETGRSETGGRETLLAVTAAVQALLVAVAVVLAAVSPAGVPVGFRYPLVVLLATAMGMQNATARRLAVPDLTTTVLTLTITGIAADRDRTRLVRRVISVVAMLVGACAGAALVLHVHIVYPLAAALVILGAVSAIASRARGRR